jgi:hypothetical protein
MFAKCENLFQNLRKKKRRMGLYVKEFWRENICTYGTKEKRIGKELLSLDSPKKSKTSRTYITCRNRKRV